MRNPLKRRHITNWRFLLAGMILATGISAHTQGLKVSGMIVAKETGAPVPHVTVYINGTSNGTTSAGDGTFELPEVTLPCEIIFSHVSYMLINKWLQDPSQLEDLRISLDQKIVALKGATVIHDLLREQYLRRFKTWFLGRDFDAYEADILNDSVLIFDIRENEQFSVYANEPILVALPETGYLLKVDLVKFDLQHREEFEGYHCSILGYYLFEPIEIGSRRDARMIARNRTEHYYNSSMHFCRSLYHNRLAENGYILERVCNTDSEGSSADQAKPDFIASYGSDAYSNRQLLLSQFACNRFRITFCYNSRNRPVDLTYLDANPTRIEKSGLLMLSDTVRIYPSGRIPGNTMLFSDAISQKGVASLLPEDYIPSMQ